MVYAEPLENGRATGTTPGGTPYARIDLAFGARLAYVYVPTRVTAWTHTSLLHVIHGMTGTRTFAEGALGKPILDAALDRGWIVASASNGNTWGNPQAMTDLRNLYEYVAMRWWIDHTLTFGHSMGGMASMVVGGRREVPSLAAVVSLNGMIDTQDYGDSTTLTSYGASDWTDLLAKQAGHDPVRDDPARWANLPIMLIDTLTDTSKRQSDLFISRSTTPAFITQATHTGGHMDNPKVAETLAFLAANAPAYIDGQTIDTQPVPKWPGWDDGSPAPGGGSSGLYRNGAEVSLYDTTGQSATIN